MKYVNQYQVWVGNIGLVHEGNSKTEAKVIFNEYQQQSKNGYGRASGESVTLLDQEDVIDEFNP